jgi:hypothetical protein
LFFYTATASLGGAITICFSPVAVLVANAYGVNVMLVNMCSISYMATYIPISFLVIWMFKNMNSAIVFRIGIAMALCGTWLR